ncbi:hypothetical protein IG631_00609 [Alternaria alternata]|nr:hypothetical protein IG631_00609 [Alternaria alternata]
MHRQRISSATSRTRRAPRHRRDGEREESPTDNGTATGKHLVELNRAQNTRRRRWCGLCGYQVTECSGGRCTFAQ